MVIVNSKNPNIAYPLLDYFVPVDQTREQIAFELYNRLKFNPNDTLCLAFEDKKQMVGFACLYREDDGVFFWQTHCAPGIKHSKTLYALVENWAKTKGNKLRCGAKDERTAKFFNRKYGFIATGNKINNVAIEMVKGV